MPPPRLIPVLDVMNGQVVRAVGGRRDEYKPVESKLTTSTDPVEVASVLLEATGTSELYVADLDAIRGGHRRTPSVFEATNRFTCVSWVDVGANDQESVAYLAATWFTHPVLALESVLNPALLTWAAANQLPFAFSLDLKAGRLLGRWADWGAAHDRDALAVARTATRAGAKTLIVLDLARVGTGTGSGTEDLLRQVRDEFPDLDLIAGGGVRTWADIERLGEAGATGVLVASALHDGTLRVGSRESPT